MALIESGIFMNAFLYALKRRPFFISHLITGRCNARCLTCKWRSEEKDGGLTEILRFYRQAREMGFYSTILWGGEPLMMEDIIEIVKGVKGMGYRIGIITNGYYLKEHTILFDYLDFLILSIDALGNRLDKIRNLPGLFYRIVEGLKYLRGVKLFFNTVVSNFSYPACLLVPAFAKNYKAIVFYEYPIGKGLIDKDIAQKAFTRILRMKQSGMRIGNSVNYLKSGAEGMFEYRCRVKDFSITIDNAGWLKDCITGKTLGNVYKEKLKEILKRKEYQEFKRRTHNCHRCTDSGAYESSQVVHFKFESILNSLWIFIS